MFVNFTKRTKNVEKRLKICIISHTLADGHFLISAPFFTDEIGQQKNVKSRFETFDRQRGNQNDTRRQEEHRTPSFERRL